MIYAMRILGGKFIKIGFTEGVEARMAELQTGCPFELTLVFVVEGTLLQEQSIHHALRRGFGRIHIPTPPNEWYPGRCPFFQEFLSQLRLGTSAGLAFAQSRDPAVDCPDHLAARRVLVRGGHLGSSPGRPTENPQGHTEWVPQWPVKG